MGRKVENGLVWLGIFLTGCLVVILLSLPALAQEHHDAGHNDYSNWASQKTQNCCNNQDCGDLADSQWRHGKEGDEILIHDQWCPVQQEHYVIKGRSPDWMHAHACVNRRTSYLNPCDALLCFMGVPKT